MRVGLLFRPVLGGVQNRENAEAFSVHSIGDDIRCARHDEFSRFGFAPGMTEVGMLGKPFRRLEDALSQSACGRGLSCSIYFRISTRLAIAVSDQTIRITVEPARASYPRNATSAPRPHEIQRGLLGRLSFPCGR